MLIHVGGERTVAIDLRLAIWLALAAGAINAAGFRSLGYFSANMTGNVSTISDMLALGNWRSALLFAALLVAFVLGAFVSTLLIEAGRQRQIHGIYAFSIVLEALLLLGLALLDLSLPPEFADWTMLLGLSLLMGLQNAATTHISDARVRSTHVSGVATDIGIELAMLTGRGDKARVGPRLKLHGATLAAFLLGGIAGVWGYEQAGPLVFVAVSALLAGLAVPQLARR
ncbi:YoaK family protein [Pseudoroseicyclus sp. H15]